MDFLDWQVRVVAVYCPKALKAWVGEKIEVICISSLPLQGNLSKLGSQSSDKTIWCYWKDDTQRFHSWAFQFQLQTFLLSLERYPLSSMFQYDCDIFFSSSFNFMIFLYVTLRNVWMLILEIKGRKLLRISSSLHCSRWQ